MKKFFLLLLSIAILASCSEKSLIQGNIKDADNATIYFEHTLLSESIILDSVRLNSKGDFKFTVDKPVYPDFYRIRLDNKSIVVALDSITDNVFISVSANDFNNPTINGSDDSNDILKLRKSSYQLQLAARNGDMKQIAEMLESHKNLAHEIILKNTRSAAAYYAINQMINGHYYMSPYTKEDLPYWSAVATAYDLYYPEYDRAKELKQSTLLAIGSERMSKLSADKLIGNIKEEGFIDIELPNRVGETTRLSSLKGKVVLIDFSAYAMEQISAHTLFLRELHNKYSEEGFEIYQVSVDDNRLLWLEQSRNTPWICVRDDNSTRSTYLATYNVTQLPTFFLMDQNANIVGRYNHENVEKAVRDLLK